jgi:hypothetical protein
MSVPNTPDTAFSVTDKTIMILLLLPLLLLLLLLLLKQPRDSEYVIPNTETEDDEKPVQSTFALKPITPPEIHNVY